MRSKLHNYVLIIIMHAVIFLQSALSSQPYDCLWSHNPRVVYCAFFIKGKWLINLVYNHILSNPYHSLAASGVLHLAASNKLRINLCHRQSDRTGEGTSSQLPGCLAIING